MTWRGMGRFGDYYGGSWGPLPQQPIEPPLPPIEKFGGRFETHQLYLDFAGIAKDYWNEQLSVVERNNISTLVDDLRLQASEYPYKGAAEEHLPTAVRQEYSTDHRDKMAAEKIEREAAQALQDLQDAQKKKWLRKAKLTGALGILFAGVICAGIYSESVDDAMAAQQRRNQSVARNPDNLRAMGICAADMAMESRYDSMTNYATDMEIATNSIALETAQKAKLPCVEKPYPTANVSYLGEYSGQAQRGIIERSQLTEYVSKAWPYQKRALQQEFEYAGEEADSNDYRMRIKAGDQVYNSRNK